MPHPGDPDRIYDRVFIDGIYTDVSKAIYALALKLTKTTNVDQAREWTLRLHDFRVVDKRFLNGKRHCQNNIVHSTNSGNGSTCGSARYTTRCHIYRTTFGFFTYLQPSSEAFELKCWVSATNSLEGGINAQLKRIADAHRGRSRGRQRKMLE